MTKEEIALQLTLKAIERMASPTSAEAKGTAATYNSVFSQQICEFYNYLNKNLNCYNSDSAVDSFSGDISSIDIV